MKIYFTFSEEKEKEFQNELSKIDELIRSKGLKRKSFGLYVGSEIPEEVMLELQLRILVNDWFRESADCLWIWVDENNEYGEDTLAGFLEMNKMLKEAGAI